MEFVSSCQAIKIWEDIVIQGVGKGFIKQVHNGRCGVIESCNYTNTYHINLKNYMEPAVVKFWYDTRERDKGIRKDVASVKITVEDLVAILSALAGKDFDIKADGLNVSKDKNGIRIVQK